MQESIQCESCINYEYDEILDGGVCLAYLDEDEWVRYGQDNYKSCPYYRSGDEYEIVRKQN